MNILIIQQRGWALKFGIPLAKYLKKKHPAAKFAAFVYKPDTWERIKKDNFHYEYKWLGYKNDDNLLNPTIKKNIQKINIKDIENDLSIESVWKDLIYSDRSMVYTPGKKWRYSYKKQISNDTMIDLVKFNYFFIKNEIFNKFKPDIVFAPNFGSLFHNVLFHFLKKRNINCWMPTASKISKRLILTNEIDYSLSPIVKKFKKKHYSEENFNNAKKYIHDFRLNYNPPDQLKYNIPKSISVEHMYKYKPINILDSTFKIFVGEFLRLPVKIFRQFKKNLNKNNPRLYRIIDNQSIIDTFKNFFIKYKNIINAKYFKYYNLNTNKIFFYYLPLHVEPEISTNLWAPMFANQLEVIRKSAISLPYNYTLVVKEHPIFIGRRSVSYYKKISGLPNVNLISPRTTNAHIISNEFCKGSIVISGTVGFETILMKKKTYVLSKFFYTSLPHATHVSDFTKLSKIIKDNDKLDLNINENEELLIQMLAVLFENSFELSYSAIGGGLVDSNIDIFLEKCEEKILDLKLKL